MASRGVAGLIDRKLRGLEPEKRDSQLERFRQWWEDKGKDSPLYEPEERQRIRSVLGLVQRVEDLPFRELVPQGWFLDLLDIQGESEAPTPFYFLAGMAVFSQLVGRKVMIDRGNHIVGVDTSALLISPAGRGRRSTACDFVVYDIGEQAGLYTIADSFTYEAFAESLIRSAATTPGKGDPRCIGASALAYAGEMSVLLGKGSYADSIIPKLTDIIGKVSKFNWETVKRGKIEFVNPCVNALFTSAPDWLVEAIPSIVLGGGTLSRFLICVREDPEKVVTWGDPLSPTTIRELVTDLKLLTDRKGVFIRPTGEAYKWYDEWYQRHQKETLYGEIADERMAPYYSRKHTHLLKMAALLHLAAGEEVLEFTEERLAQALNILDWLEQDVPKAYARMALSPIAAAQRAVYEAIKRAGGTLEHSKLQKKVYRHCPLKDQFHAILESLVAMQVIARWVNPSGRGHSYHIVKPLE